jgi:hypothetical protein
MSNKLTIVGPEPEDESCGAHSPSAEKLDLTLNI